MAAARQGWRPLDGEPRHPLEIARDHLEDALPVLTGDPMTTSTSFVQGSARPWDAWTTVGCELLRRAARQVLKVLCMASKIMLVKPTLAVTRPAETGLLVRALAQCLRAATAVLTETTQPTANPGKWISRRSLD
jgi:hypothetical protein